MKNRRLYLYIAFLLAAVSCVFVSCKSTGPAMGEKVAGLEKSLLWKITADNIEPSYLFGTIHLIGKEDYFFPDHMQAAFDETKTLALEFNLDDAMDMGNMMSLFQKALMRNDTTLEDLMNREDYALVKDHFDEVGLPIFMLQRIKPMFLTIFGSSDLMSGDGFNMEDIKSYEMELTTLAKAAGNSLAGLETMEYQLAIFDRIPYRDQAEMLIESIRSADVQSSELDSLVHYYKQQDLEKLDALINASGPTVAYKDVLLDDRNANWIPVIDSLLHAGPSFIAVGAGHLPGSKGVIRLLQKAGYKLTPINPANGLN